MTTPHITVIDPFKPTPVWERPRCEADTQGETARWKASRGRSIQCQFTAHYVVDGKQLCRRHAGIEVLERLCPE